MPIFVSVTLSSEMLPRILVIVSLRALLLCQQWFRTPKGEAWKVGCRASKVQERLSWWLAPGFDTGSSELDGLLS